jgi:hypothetical protein
MVVVFLAGAPFLFWIGLTKIEYREGQLVTVPERPGWCGLANNDPIQSGEATEEDLAFALEEGNLSLVVQIRGVHSLLDQSFCKANPTLVGKRIRITGKRVASDEVTGGPLLANLSCFRVSSWKPK